MNMKDKTYRLLEVIEHPDRFSEEEIREMLSDSETSALYKLMNKTSDALTETSDPDIDNEWECFVKNNSKPASSKSRIINPLRVFFNRNAAAILICAVASFAVVAATIGITYSLEHTRKEPQMDEDMTIAAASTMDNSEKEDSVPTHEITSIEPRTVIFKNEPFGNIIQTISDYYGASVNYENDKSKELYLYFQWDQTLSLNEIIEELNNFEQINMKLTNNTITIE